ncbi:hypothetical protein HMI55_004753 [Coelomomyces lativittatus]|nr:hypothetical protein HMI55_004753 [Coelomomyces lativittatus]
MQAMLPVFLFQNSSTQLTISKILLKLSEASTLSPLSQVEPFLLQCMDFLSSYVASFDLPSTLALDSTKNTSLDSETSLVLSIIDNLTMALCSWLTGSSTFVPITRSLTELKEFFTTHPSILPSLLPFFYLEWVGNTLLSLASIHAEFHETFISFLPTYLKTWIRFKFKVDQTLPMDQLKFMHLLLEKVPQETLPSLPSMLENIYRLGWFSFAHSMELISECAHFIERALHLSPSLATETCILFVTRLFTYYPQLTTSSRLATYLLQLHPETCQRHGLLSSLPSFPASPTVLNINPLSLNASSTAWEFLHSSLFQHPSHESIQHVCPTWERQMAIGSFTYQSHFFGIPSLTGRFIVIVIVIVSRSFSTLFERTFVYVALFHFYLDSMECIEIKIKT